MPISVRLGTVQHGSLQFVLPSSSQSGYRRAMARRIFGSVEKRGKRYRARYQSGGRWVTAQVTFATKADANAWLAGQQTDTGRGTWVDPSLGKELFGEYARKWLETRSDLAETTRAKYQGLLGLHILPAFGHCRIAQVDPAAVRHWYHALAAKYESTGDDAYRLLRAIMNTAVADKRVGRSPCTVKGAGATESAKRPIATIAELQGAVDALLPRYRAGFALAAWCQLRRGEVLGLQRRHVDMEALTIRVEQEWVVPPGKRPILKAPKTAAGYRVIDIPPNIAEVIQEHLDSFVGPGPTAWLFATANGTPIQPRNFFRAVGEGTQTGGTARTYHPRLAPLRAYLVRGDRCPPGRADAPWRAQGLPGGDPLPTSDQG